MGSQTGVCKSNFAGTLESFLYRHIKVIEKLPVLICCLRLFSPCQPFLLFFKDLLYESDVVAFFFTKKRTFSQVSLFALFFNMKTF